MNKPTLLVLAASVTLGVLVTARVLYLREAEVLVAGSAETATAEYGERLIRNTVEELGSGQPDPARRYSGNSLDCASCHLDSGKSPGMLSLLQAAAKYPAFSGRDGGEADLTDRINGCMQRSMAGRRMPRDSVEMQAMVTYVEQLGRQYLAMGESSRVADEPPDFAEPDRRADLEHGAQVYVARCQICHGSKGEGLLATTDPLDGYLFPPLWGPESYNIGAGMARVLTAARFIKARMPLGSPDLSDAEAFDVAAYMNMQERPAMENLANDYPDRTRKPIDSPYPPYADPFSVEQHRLGPYAPIRAFYAEQ